MTREGRAQPGPFLMRPEALMWGRFRIFPEPVWAARRGEFYATRPLWIGESAACPGSAARSLKDCCHEDVYQQRRDHEAHHRQPFQYGQQTVENIFELLGISLITEVRRPGRGTDRRRGVGIGVASRPDPAPKAWRYRSTPGDN